MRKSDLTVFEIASQRGRAFLIIAAGNASSLFSFRFTHPRFY